MSFGPLITARTPPPPSVASQAPILGQDVLCPDLRGDCRRQLLRIESRTSPRDVLVVDVVRHSVVVEWAEQPLANALEEIAAVDQVLLTETQQVTSVRPIWRGGEAEAAGGEPAKGKKPKQAQGKTLTAKQLLDDERVTVWDYSWTAGARLPMSLVERETIWVWLCSRPIWRRPLRALILSRPATRAARRRTRAARGFAQLLTSSSP